MKTLVLGATPNPARYAYLAVERLRAHGHEVVPAGLKKGAINGLEIQNGKPELEGIDTVTLYLNPTNQKEWYSYILGLSPRRIIFNPGTENPELEALARQYNIEPVTACTLVMLATGEYEKAKK